MVFKELGSVNKLVYQSRLPVVNVSNDGDISDISHAILKRGAKVAFYLAAKKRSGTQNLLIKDEVFTIIRRSGVLQGQNKILFSQNPYPTSFRVCGDDRFKYPF